MISEVCCVGGGGGGGWAVLSGYRDIAGSKGGGESGSVGSCGLMGYRILRNTCEMSWGGTLPPPGFDCSFSHLSHRLYSTQFAHFHLMRKKDK